MQVDLMHRGAHLEILRNNPPMSGARTLSLHQRDVTMAVTASFIPSSGVLTVLGDNLNNSTILSRSAAGNILVNGGAVSVLGGTPTVANTALMQVFGLGGDDVITINEANGAMPKANLFGGAGNDIITAGSGA